MYPRLGTAALNQLIPKTQENEYRTLSRAFYAENEKRTLQ